ncbi:hypothetical protein [Blautia hydrogenotrophica]|uniref:Uncharacterized protein n=1 Tax=Blautia hydrogenotrophica (strain DSM 10507 / JCM 14656 / S5a33) TaxID=476272 RepID=C0CP23_BLAHS|nr:hypothetical protein [Blautia hydrogenotrophica]SCH70109.1 Uncharacterised protein [uncultured Blautia sp.]EEG48480.1 hypothetical protein RUMHYD_02624 [Blautia hydrogenotrophica DSM 10507]WPX84738.1 hypothetical protein BLHYD_27550 [Blautia hydrogenotrophica DSM 10507]CCX57964.1 putative uncharacterized protein [Blautia hydrogenotrophica CAG:147]CUN11187.1 Uncharacterised protein [Blautia hydrogenotrophica]
MAEFCRGYLACLRAGERVTAFATPIYYFEMAGQTKTLLDRANSLYGSEYAFDDIYPFVGGCGE